MDQVLKSLEGSNARVLIVARSDGAFTYRLQAKFGESWDPPGPAVGIYDTAESAEQEARARVWWLASGVAEG